MLENVLVSLHSLKAKGLAYIIFKEWRVTRTFSYTECLIEWLVGKAISYRGSNDLNKNKLYKIQLTVCVAQYLLSTVAFGKLLFVFLLFFYRPLSCLSFLELPLWYLRTFLRRILTAQVQQSDACFQYLFC
jgi:hypothetical protein